MWRVEHLVRLITTFVVGTLPLTLAAQQHTAVPCQRGATRAVFRGDVLGVTNDPPCRLVFRPTGVRLTAVADGSRPDPGRLVEKDGRGRYYSANAHGWGPVISVWSPDGSYLSSFGNIGGGPGEFVSDNLALFVDGGDSLHVRDASNWSIFSPDHDYVRRAPSRRMGLEKITTVLLLDGRILSSDGYGSTGNSYFRMVNRDASLDRTFGTAEDGTGAGGYYGHDRAIAYVAGSRAFWAAPSVQGPNEYVLEQWDALGHTIVQSLRRHQPWFKWTGDETSSPAVKALHITEDGLLYVQIWRTSEGFAEAMRRFEDRMEHGGGGSLKEIQEEMEELAGSLTQVVIEVIDVRSGQLLTSATYPAGEVLRGNPLLPHGFFRNEMTGYVYRVGEDGLPYVEIIEGVLEGK